VKKEEFRDSSLMDLATYPCW